MKTKQDLLLAKAQLKAFKINIKHLRKENGRFRSAIEYLKAKLQMNNLDTSADYGEVLGGAGIGIASVFGPNETTESGGLGLHIDTDSIDPATSGELEASTLRTSANSPLRVSVPVSRPSTHVPFYPTSSAGRADEPFLFVPYEVNAAPGSPGSIPAPAPPSPTRIRYPDLAPEGLDLPGAGAAVGRYGPPLSDNERFYKQELSRSTTTPPSKYILSLDNPGRLSSAGAGRGASGPSSEEKRVLHLPLAAAAWSTSRHRQEGVRPVQRHSCQRGEAGPPANHVQDYLKGRHVRGGWVVGAGGESR